MSDSYAILVLSGVTLLTTAVLIPALGWWLTRLIKMKDTLVAKNLALWQESAKERHLGIVRQLDDLDACMVSVKKAVHTKVDLVECMRLSAEKWERINKHSHDQRGNVVIRR